MGILEKLFTEEELQQIHHEILNEINWKDVGKKTLKYGALLGGSALAGALIHDYIIGKGASSAADKISQTYQQQYNHFDKEAQKYSELADKEIEQLNKELEQVPPSELQSELGQSILPAIYLVCHGFSSSCIEEHKGEIARLSQLLADVFKEKNIKPSEYLALAKTDPNKFNELSKEIKDIIEKKLKNFNPNDPQAIEQFKKALNIIDLHKHYFASKEYLRIHQLYKDSSIEAGSKAYTVRNELMKQARQDMFIPKIKSSISDLIHKIW